MTITSFLISLAGATMLLLFAVRKRYFKHLEGGASESFEASDIHLETLRSLLGFNSHIAVMAYPILYRNRQILETLLIEEIPTTEAYA